MHLGFRQIILFIPCNLSFLFPRLCCKIPYEVWTHTSYLFLECSMADIVPFSANQVVDIFFRVNAKRATGVVLSKKLCIIKISPNSKESTCARVAFLDKEALAQCFPVNLSIFKNNFWQNTSGWLLLLSIIHITLTCLFEKFPNFLTVISLITLGSDTTLTSLL